MAKNLKNVKLRTAPPSRAFSDLKGVVAANLTAGEYDALLTDAYLESNNRELVQDIQLIGQAKQGPGSPKAGTSKVVVDSTNDTGARVIFTPSQGEVFLLEEMLMTADTTGTWTFSLDLVVPPFSMPIFPTTSKTDTHLRFGSAFGWPNSNTFLDENTTVFVTFGGSFTSINTYLLLTRYR